MIRKIKRGLLTVLFNLGLTQTDGIRVRLLLPNERTPLIDAISNHITHRRRVRVMMKGIKRYQKNEYVKFY